MKSVHPSIVKKASGFSLVEVLVAVLILSFGLLGLAALQIGSLRHNQSSHQRGQAILIAYELADRMRGNRDAAINEEYQMDASLPDKTGVKNCETEKCAKEELAAYDKYVWLSGDVDLDGDTTPDEGGVVNTLPDGRAIVSCDTAPCTIASTHTITVMWNDVIDTIVDADGNAVTDGAGLAQRKVANLGGCDLDSRLCLCQKLTCFHVNFQP